jgi:hypothetical protein
MSCGGVASMWWLCVMLSFLSLRRSLPIGEVDQVYRFNLTVSTNHYTELLRQVSAETMRWQTTDLLSVPVDTPVAELRSVLVQSYCPVVQASAAHCADSVDTVAERFAAHVAREAGQVVAVKVQTSAVDVGGFARRRRALSTASPATAPMNLANNPKLSQNAISSNSNDYQHVVNDHSGRPLIPDTHFYHKKHRLLHHSQSHHNQCQQHCQQHCPLPRSNAAGDVAVVVTGFWPVSVTKYSSPFTDNDISTTTTSDTTLTGQPSSSTTTTTQQKNQYNDWFNHTLRINMPYIFFHDPAVLSDLATFRHGLPTLFVAWEPAHFRVSAAHFPSAAIHPQHVPSVPLAQIWLEKMQLVAYAAQIHGADFYIWIDAGLSSYRHQPLPSRFEFSKEVLLSLPKQHIGYSLVMGEYHSVASTVMIFPKDIVLLAQQVFYEAVHMCFATATTELAWQCGSEQFIWTKVREDYPEMFHAMSYDYGDIDFLWGSNR